MKNPEQFVYWLKGFFELYEGNSLTETQLKRIKIELDAIFAEPTKIYDANAPYIQPSMGPPYSPLNVPPNNPFIPGSLSQWTIDF